MKKTLVVFYSRTGYTRALAELLAHELDADLDEIREPRGRGGVFGFVRSGYEALKAVTPAILTPGRLPHTYECVVIGTPVWAGHVSSPVRAYLGRYKEALKRVAFFCTYGHEGQEPVLAEMAAILGRPPEATLGVSDADIAQHHDDRSAGFVKDLLAHAV